MKRIISAILCIALLASAVFCVAPASAAGEGLDVPLIYIQGQGASLYRNPNTPQEEQIFPIQIPEGYIEEKIDIFLPVFAKAFFTQEWDEFCVVLTDIIVPLFEDLKLDKNGEASDGSGVKWTFSESTLTDRQVNGKYHVFDYEFEYDWRIDPWQTADILHEYVQAVKKVTGKEKVSLLGRCLGANIVSAYLTKYGDEHIDEVIFYASAAHGVEMASKCYTGELFLESDGIERFVYDLELFEDDQDNVYDRLLEGFVTALNKTYGLDVLCWAVNNVFEDIYLDIMPPVMSETFGTFPGYWSMVNEEDFEKAKATIFYGSEPGEYDGMIAKLDNYHNKVKLGQDDVIRSMSNNGIEFSNIAKYGLQLYPVANSNNYVSDNTCDVNAASMGATASDIEGVLSDEYIEQAKKNGTFKYISPDRQIDASTCMFPDSTWFIKDITHQDFPDYVNNLMVLILNNDDFTVFDSPTFPQYMVYDKENRIVVPMTEENMNTTEEWKTNYFEALYMIFESLFKIIRDYLSNL